MSIIVEIMRTNADPLATQVYEALDVDFAVPVRQISQADAAKAEAALPRRPPEHLPRAALIRDGR